MTATRGGSVRVVRLHARRVDGVQNGAKPADSMAGSAVEDDAVEVEEDAVEAEESTVRLPAEGQAAPASLVGTTLNERYRLLEVIGDGGMGRVYRAEQLATGKAVALKLLHPEFVGVDQVVKRFEREATVMTQLSHPHIVNVIELGEWNGRLFLAMELLAGKTLAELIGDGAKGGRRQTIKWTLAIMRPMLDALEYAHERGVVHRDLKPENIMVAPARPAVAREHQAARLRDREAGRPRRAAAHRRSSRRTAW